MVTQDELKRMFIYVPESGNFYKDGEIVGCLNKAGYFSIKVKRKTYLAHRLAWIYMRGDIPTGFDIDHINMQRSDNRIFNLRLATRSQNMQNAYKAQSNNKTKLRGVSFDARSNRYRARIKYQGKQITIGWFTNADEASLAYLNAKRKNHEFSTI